MGIKTEGHNSALASGEDEKVRSELGSEEWGEVGTVECLSM